MTQDTLTVLRAAANSIDVAHDLSRDDNHFAARQKLDEVVAGLCTLIVAMEKQEPVAFMWQHDETGRVGFVEASQPMDKWAEGNPRLHIIGPLYTHAQPVEQPQQEPVGKMTAQRAKFFVQRFKKEEKLLGPNEQAALDFAIKALEKEQYTAQPVEQPSEVDRLRADLVKAEAFTRTIWHKNERLRAAAHAQPVEQPPLKLLAQALDVIKSECGYGGTNTYDPRAIVEEIEQAIRSKP